MSVDPASSLLSAVRACTRCASQLPLGPRPVLQLHSQARVLVASQAPGRRAHDSGVPFDGPAARACANGWACRPRSSTIRSELQFCRWGSAIPAAGPAATCRLGRSAGPRGGYFCLPGSPTFRLTLAIGQHAQAFHLSDAPGTLTDRVRSWSRYGPAVIPLPHPSPRNNPWLRRNPWFEAELLPMLRLRCAAVLAGAGD